MAGCGTRIRETYSLPNVYNGCDESIKTRNKEKFAYEKLLNMCACEPAVAWEMRSCEKTITVARCRELAAEIAHIPSYKVNVAANRWA